MLSLKLTLLSLLIAAPGLLVNGENMITCYGDIHHLHCDTGMIEVKSTIYGRTDNTTCCTKRISATTKCSLAISTVADRCNGLRDCELKTNLLGNPDPCPGISKYYNTIYSCINGHLAVICENSYSTLDCGTESIHILNANYGRDDTLTCVKGLPSRLIQNTNCYAPNTRTILSTQCNGKKKCPIRASNAAFTDPCPGIAKYLTVFYICTREIVACEISTAYLNCGTQKIKIISANYGRTDSTTCSKGRPASQLSNRNCYTADTFNKVVARCAGQSSCNVPATNSFFSDKCVGTYKYLKIVYGCV